MNNISILVGLKNNLSYTKNFYKTTRHLYPDVEICFVSYDSNDGTHEWLDEIKTNDNNVKIFYQNKIRSFSDTYNKAAEIATKEYILFAHNDMIFYDNFLENINKHLSLHNIVSYTTIEPSIFSDHSRPGKIIYDCGIDLNTFNSSSFYEYCKLTQTENKDKTQDGIVFFMSLRKQLFLDIGGFDNLFMPFFREDDDLIKRLKMLENKKYFTALDALCYHFVSKTSRFSEQYRNVTSIIELINIRNYIRKWGSVSCEKTFPIDLIIKNASIDALSAFEPYGQEIYIDCGNHTDTDVIIEQYISSEQKKTNIFLKNKIHNMHKAIINNNNNVCHIDCDKIDQKDIENINNIQSIISKIDAPQPYKIGNLDLSIKSLDTINKSKIYNYKYNVDKYLNGKGPKRWDIINHLIKQNNYKRYLEIGVHDGSCIRNIIADVKDGVDPGSETKNPSEVNYPVTSDAFFELTDKSLKYDIIFIDGLHHSDQVDKDIENSLQRLNSNGIIVLHDCNPPLYELQAVPRQTGLWNGDVWKSIAKLRCYRDDLWVSVINTDWGVGVVRPGKQTLYQDATYEYIINNWEYFDKNREEILNIISVQEFYSVY